MTRMRRALLLPLFLAHSLSLAEGRPFEAQAVVCKRLGEFAISVAEARDAGTPRSTVLGKLPKGDTPARRLVDGIYGKPSMTPREAGTMELACLLDTPAGSSSQR